MTARSIGKALQVVLVVVGVGLAQPYSAKAQLPDTFTNLQMLPEDITQELLILTMKNFSTSLDVRCDHCHVGEGDDLSKYDFASDEKSAKAGTRLMLEMVREINQTHLSKLAEDGMDAPRVQCMMCHRGKVTPELE